MDCLRACSFRRFSRSPPGKSTFPPRDRNGDKRALFFRLELAQANHPRLWRNILTTLKTVTETASEVGKEANESIEELVRSAGRRLDEADRKSTRLNSSH